MDMYKVDLAPNLKSDHRAGKTILKIGLWAALTAFVSMLGFFVAQLFQVLGWLIYPWDQILIFSSSLAIAIPFLLAMLALYHSASSVTKFWSHAALLFSLIYVVFVTANYVVQLATVIPMTIKGTSENIQLLKQTPHSLFWDFDAIGYLFMGLATLFAVPVFRQHGFERWIRYAFLSHALVTPCIAFVYFYPDFSDRLLWIALPWTITAPLCMLLLAIFFRQNSIKTDTAAL
ncbi:MAG: hypothetical protein V4520_12350 [Bacteroidota bacterium]